MIKFLMHCSVDSKNVIRKVSWTVYVNMSSPLPKGTLATKTEFVSKVDGYPMPNVVKLLT